MDELAILCKHAHSHTVTKFIIKPMIHRYVVHAFKSTSDRIGRVKVKKQIFDSIHALADASRQRPQGQCIDKLTLLGDGSNRERDA